MDLQVLKSIFKVFQPQMEEEYPRMCINMVGGVVINVDNNIENKITLTSEYMKIETPKSLTFLCLDDIIKMTIHKKVN